MKLKTDQLEEKAQKKATRLAKVAARLFNEKGYLDTSLDNIATAARVSKGAIYHYFSSKNELLYFILNNYLDLILDGLEERLLAIEEPVERIRAVIVRHIKLYTENVAEAKTLLHDAPCLPSVYYKVIEQKERTYYRLVANAVSDLFGGTLDKGRLTVLTFALFAMCNWIYSWYNPRGPVTPKELSDIVCNLFLYGVAGNLPSREADSTCRGGN